MAKMHKFYLNCLLLILNYCLNFTITMKNFIGNFIIIVLYFILVKNLAITSSSFVEAIITLYQIIIKFIMVIFNYLNLLYLLIPNLFSLSFIINEILIFCVDFKYYLFVFKNN